jgi:DNA-binding CsgD family transcriptional regulator
MRQVARELDLSRTTVAKHLGDRGIKTSRRMSAEQSAEAVHLCGGGMSSLDVGAILGFDNHTVLEAVADAGMPIRKSLGR